MWRRGKLKHLEENSENIFITCKGANILKQNVKSINTNHEKKIVNSLHLGPYMWLAGLSDGL